jgi:hypothetical protein
LKKEMEMPFSTDTNVHCNKSELNEAFLWKITLQKRENSHFDTGTFIPPLTRFLYILLCGKSVPFYGREHFTFLRRQCFCYFLELSFFHRNVPKIHAFPHFSRIFLENSRGKNVLCALPLPGSFWKRFQNKRFSHLKMLALIIYCSNKWK